MYEDEDSEEFQQRKPNTLHVWGNDKTMNLNSLLLTNIQSSHYFKVNLFGLKTYHEVVDEIYYNVGHMEPWEKGSRKASQSGMCGGVRGVGTGGIVSTAFSCLYKMFTLRLTKKQINGLLNHCDSPYIRGVGFLYLRYTQPPADLYGWFEPYLDDEEIIDVRAGGGEEVTIGHMCRRMLSKLDWYGTLFPRIPVPTEMKIQRLLKERFPEVPPNPTRVPMAQRARDEITRGPRGAPEPDGPRWRDRERTRRDSSPAASRDIAEEIALEKERIQRERDAGSRRTPEVSRHMHSGRDHRSGPPASRSQERSVDQYRGRHGRSRSREAKRRRSRSREPRRNRSRSKEPRRDRSRSKESRRHRSRSKESRRHKNKTKEYRRHRSRSKESQRNRSRSKESRRHRSKERHHGGYRANGDMR